MTGKPESGPVTLVRALLLAGMVLLALSVNPVVPAIAAANIQPFRVEGESMLPRHQDGDFLIIRTGGASPGRGDVVVLHDPTDPRTDLIKRVIGLPGETIAITNGRVLIDGDALDEPYIRARWDGSMRPVTLHDGDYFVMGDNRNNSTDSRAFGPVSGSEFIGREIVSYWPLSRHAGGFTLVAGVLVAWVLLAVTAIAATATVATRRGRSGWWCIAAWLLGGIGLLSVYLLLGRKEHPAAIEDGAQTPADV